MSDFSWAAKLATDFGVLGLMAFGLMLFYRLADKWAAKFLEVQVAQLRFAICVTPGCGSETTINYIATMGSGTFTECAFNLATAPAGSPVIVDVQDGTGTSIFGVT
jgi:hypothetical protein